MRAARDTRFADFLRHRRFSPPPFSPPSFSRRQPPAALILPPRDRASRHARFMLRYGCRRCRRALFLPPLMPIRFITIFIDADIIFFAMRRFRRADAAAAFAICRFSPLI